MYWEIMESGAKPIAIFAFYYIFIIYYIYRHMAIDNNIIIIRIETCILLLIACNARSVTW